MALRPQLPLPTSTEGHGIVAAIDADASGKAKNSKARHERALLFLGGREKAVDQARI
jgi:hypothetical protein